MSDHRDIDNKLLAYFTYVKKEGKDSNKKSLKPLIAD